MRPVRAITTIVFAAAVAAAVTGSYIAYSTHAAQPSSRTSGPTSAAFDRQAAVHAAALRQFVTPGTRTSLATRGRFPRIFVLDRAVAGTGDTTRKANPDGSELIPPAVRHAITHALADVAPPTSVTSPAAAIDQQHPNRVRDEGILATFGPLVGVGDRVQVGVDGFVSGVGARWLTYAVERTGGAGRCAKRPPAAQSREPQPLHGDALTPGCAPMLIVCPRQLLHHLPEGLVEAPDLRTACAAWDSTVKSAQPHHWRACPRPRGRN